MNEKTAASTASSLGTTALIIIATGILAGGASAVVEKSPAGMIVGGSIFAASIIAYALVRAVAEILATLLRIEHHVNRGK